MANVKVVVDGNPLFDGEISDWHPLPDIPQNPSPADFTQVPRQQRRAIRQAMSKAAHAALDKALDRSVGTD